MGIHSVIKNIFLSSLIVIGFAVSSTADTAVTSKESISNECEWGCHGWWFPSYDEIFSRSILVHPKIEYRSSINFKENSKSYTVTVELTGIEKKDISINLVNNVLVIAAERKETKDTKDKTGHKTQHSYSSYRQSIVLPENADIHKIDATFKKGIVTITIPKTGKKATRKILIR